ITYRICPLLNLAPSAPYPLAQTLALASENLLHATEHLRLADGSQAVAEDVSHVRRAVAARALSTDTKADRVHLPLFLRSQLIPFVSFPSAVWKKLVVT